MSESSEIRVGVVILNTGLCYMLGSEIRVGVVILNTGLCYMLESSEISEVTAQCPVPFNWVS